MKVFPRTSSLVELPMLQRTSLLLGCWFSAFLIPPVRSQPSAPPREFVQITASETAPSVAALAAYDDSTAMFLNASGQIGVAKFSPGLSLIGWQHYSKASFDALPGLSLGPEFSVMLASAGELTQGFDTDTDGQLDTFQALVRDWPGAKEGVTITAGPLADSRGRVLFALSPATMEQGAPPQAAIVAWTPGQKEPETIMSSNLPVTAIALSQDGLLAALLSFPDYKDGFFLSLTELPPPLTPPSTTPSAPTGENVPSPSSAATDGEKAGHEPGKKTNEEATSAKASPPASPPLPMTLPSLLIPSEMTKGAAPRHLTFVHEVNEAKLLLSCPESQMIIEVAPEKVGELWQGSILVHTITPEPILAMSEMKPGKVLGGGAKGFFPIDENIASYRIRSIRRATDGLVLGFTEPVDRSFAILPESYAVEAVSLTGAASPVVIEPVIEYDGRTVILKMPPPSSETVLRVLCRNVPSATGAKLLSSACSYTIHQDK
jgi:hypothetical protein